MVLVRGWSVTKLSSGRVPEKLLLLLCVLLFIHAGSILLTSGNQPLSDFHEFRQTQTALSAYWMVEEGFRIIYQTPVVGHPWEIPFEFPIYHWIVAAVAAVGVPLNFAGRVVAFLFLIACIWPIRSLSRSLSLGNWWFLCATALFLASPLYILWGRSFMIETAALFFALAHLSSFIAGIVHRNIAFLACSAGLALLAILTKSTTLPAFSFLAGIFLAARVFAALPSRPSILIRTFLAPSIALVFAYPLGFVWIAASDAAKSANGVGNLLTSDALSRWNYGTLAQRFSERMWADVLPLRVMPDLFGSWAAIALLIFLLLQVLPFFNVGLSRHRGILFLLSLVGFFLPFAIFTNLHLVHNYYQVANGVFLVGALAIILDGMRGRFGSVVSAAALGLIVASQLAFFYSTYYKRVNRAPVSDIYNIAQAAKEMTADGTALFAFGNDWSSAIAYYSERKTFTAPKWVPVALVEEALRDPAATLGGLELGGTIYCRRPTELSYGPQLEGFVAGQVEASTEGACKLYLPAVQ